MNKIFLILLTLCSTNLFADVKFTSTDNGIFARVSGGGTTQVVTSTSGGYEESVHNEVAIFGGTQNYKIVRIGNKVTLAATSASTASALSGASDVFIPSEMRPPINTYFSIKYGRTIAFTVVVNTTGTVSITTDNNAGGSVTSTIPPFAVTWLLD